MRHLSVSSLGSGAAALAATLLSAPAFAALPTTMIADSGDTGWILGTFIIGLLTAIPGALLYMIGNNGWSNAPRIINASVAGMAVVTLLYFMLGYSLMFDLNGSNWLGGATNWMLNNMGTVRDGTTVAETGFVLFQLAFVLLAVTLLSSMVAARARRGWMLGFTALWFLLVLVPITRWTWGGGWLANLGMMDLTGGLTVFFCVAVSALAALGLVQGKSAAEAPTPDHGTRMIGAILLMIGMTALAGGATLGASDDAAVAMLATVAAAMTGALTLAIIRRSLDASSLASGMVAGIVGIAAAGDGVSVGGAVLTGFLSALAMLAAWSLAPKALRRFDRDAHLIGMAGAAKIGALVFAIFLAFSPFGGSGYPEGTTMVDQIIAQLIGIVVVAVWSLVGSIIAGLMASLLLPMRDAPVK